MFSPKNIRKHKPLCLWTVPFVEHRGQGGTAAVQNVMGIWVK